MSDEEVASTDGWRTFGRAVQARRRALGLLQEDVAAQIGAATSWVSQVEKGTKPSEKRASALELVLGPGIRSARPDLNTKGESDVMTEDAVGLPLLWLARADMLDNIGNLEDSVVKRRRLEGLGSDLTAFTGEHLPGTLFELSAGTPAWVRRVVLAEVASMKIDAPYDMGISKLSVRLKRVDRVVADLRLPDETSAQLNKALKDFDKTRSRPSWQELQSVGGARGRIHMFSLNQEGWDLELLISHDPVGWFGFGCAAGRWLLDEDQRAANESTGAPRDMYPEKSISPSKLGTVAAAGGSALIMSVLSPVLGTAILVGLIADRRKPKTVAGTEKNVRSSDTTQPDGEVSDEGDRQIGVESIVSAAESFGMHWVRVEASKLVSLYSILPEPAVGDLDAGLPPCDEAAGHLIRIAEVARHRSDKEERDSGVNEGRALKDSHLNARVQQLDDISDTIRAAAEALKALSAPATKTPPKRDDGPDSHPSQRGLP